MSKITIVGGDIIEKIGGRDLSFAKGEIINSGSSVIQTGQEKGVSFGKNGKAPFIKFNTDIRFYVEFEPLPSYNGEFGFDWIKVDNDDKILKIQTIDIDTLEYVFDNERQEYISVGENPNLKDNIKKEYHKVKPFDIPYYIPWLSLMSIGQEIKLNMISKPIHPEYDMSKEIISFTKNENYEIIIDGNKNENIRYIPNKEAKEVIIKCIKPSTQNDIVAVDGSGRNIGKIVAVDNSKVYELPIRLVCVVKNTINKYAEISKLISDFKEEKIEDYLNENSLNQALIKTKVEIDSKYHIAFDEELWNGEFYHKEENYFINRKDPSGGKVSYIDDDGKEVKDVDYEHILDKFLREYKNIFERDGEKFKGILLFISNISKNPEDKEGGVSRTMPVHFREAIVFGKNLKDKSTYAHEIAHALGLQHTFWENEDRNNLNTLKSLIKYNEEAKKTNDNIIQANNRNIEINKNAKNHNISIINRRNLQIKKLKNEKEKLALKVKNNSTEETNNKIDSYIKDSEDSNKELIKVNNDIDKLLEIQKSNLQIYQHNKYKYKKNSTLNIMDYSLKVNIFTHWQWKIMQNDIEKYYGKIVENK